MKIAKVFGNFTKNVHFFMSQPPLPADSHHGVDGHHRGKKLEVDTGHLDKLQDDLSRALQKIETLGKVLSSWKMT